MQAERYGYSYLLNVYLSQVFKDSLHELKDNIYSQFKRRWKKRKEPERKILGYVGGCMVVLGHDFGQLFGT